MKKIIYLKNLLLFMFLLSIVDSYSQTKKEKTVETEVIKGGMYNSSKSKEALKYYNEAEDFEDKKDYKGAIKLYKKVLEEDPNFVEAYDNIGICYRKTGDFKRAIASYEKSIELYPKGTMAHINLGIVYIIQKDLDKAISEYEAVQKLEPENPEGYYGTIKIYLSRSDYKSAIKSATKTLEIYEATESPYLSEAQYLLGISYYYDKANAKIYLQQAKKGNIDVPEKIMNELEIK